MVKSVERHRNRGPGDTPFGNFLRQAGEVPLLSPGEEKTLARRTRAGDPTAREQMIRSNIRLVLDIAKGFTGRGIELNDLTQDGVIGLIRAVDLYEPDRPSAMTGQPVRFSTFASYWIKQSIQRAIADKAESIRVPTYLHHEIARWRRTATSLRNTLGRSPTDREIAAASGMKPKKAEHIKQAIYVRGRMVSPDLDGDHDGNRQWLESTVADPASVVESPNVEHLPEFASVAPLLDMISPTLKAIICARFGVDGRGQLLIEIAADHGISRTKTQQLFENGMMQIRKLAVGLATVKRPRRRERPPATTQCRGVSFVPVESPARPYRAKICHGSVFKHVGYFATDAEAGLAYDQARLDRGLKAVNFPGDPRLRPTAGAMTIGATTTHETSRRESA